MARKKKAPAKTKQLAKKVKGQRKNKNKQIDHPVLGTMDWSYGLWFADTPMKFAKFGELQLSFEDDQGDGPTDDQIDQISNFKKIAGKIFPKVAREIKEYYEFDCDLDDEERQEWVIKKNSDVWKYARVTDLFITENLEVKLEIEADFESHGLQGTIEGMDVEVNIFC